MKIPWGKILSFLSKEALKAGIKEIEKRERPQLTPRVTPIRKVGKRVE
jgi:hypothetical protein